MISDLLSTTSSALAREPFAERQGLGTCCEFRLESSSPRVPHGLLPHSLWVFTQMYFSLRPSLSTLIYHCHLYLHPLLCVSPQHLFTHLYMSVCVYLHMDGWVLLY